MSAWNELKKLPREQWVLAASILVNRIGTMALPFLALYATKRLGLSLERAGMLVGVYGIAALVSALVGGDLCDRWGASRICIASLFATAIVLFVFPLATSFPVVLAATFLWSFVAEIYRPAHMSLTAEHALPEQRKTAFALGRLAINLGMSVGPTLGGFVAEISFPFLFFIDGITTALGGVILWWYLRGKQSPVSTEKRGLISFHEPLRDRRFLYFILAFVPVAMVFFQQTSTMALFVVEELKFRESTYGLLCALNTILIIFIELPLNAATAKWKHRSAMFLGSLLFAVGFALLAFARSAEAIGLTIAIWTFGEMILLPQSSAYVTEISPESRRGSYMGGYTMAFSVAFIFGPWLGTLIYDKAGAVVLWLVVGGWGLLSALLFLRIKEPAPAA